ncbi:MAG: type III-B CRISPR module-associated protein Cmr5 [Chitinophagales bacterium]
MKRSVTRHFSSALSVLTELEQQWRKSQVAAGQNKLSATDPTLLEQQEALRRLSGSYQTTVAAFGADIVTSGLVPALQYYCAPSENKSNPTREIVEAVAKMLNKKNAAGLRKTAIAALGNRKEIIQLTKEVCDATIALKIMMRTYELEKNQKELLYEHE